MAGEELRQLVADAVANALGIVRMSYDDASLDKGDVILAALGEAGYTVARLQQVEYVKHGGMTVLQIDPEGEPLYRKEA